MPCFDKALSFAAKTFAQSGSINFWNSCCIAYWSLKIILCQTQHYGFSLKPKKEKKPK